MGVNLVCPIGFFFPRFFQSAKGLPCSLFYHQNFELLATIILAKFQMLAKILAKYSLFQNFCREQNTRTKFEVCSLKKYSHFLLQHLRYQRSFSKQAIVANFSKYFQKILAQLYSQLSYLLAWIFTRTNYKRQKMLASSSLFFVFFSLSSFSHFFLLAFFSLHARKKRISEEKKTYGLSRKGLTTPLGNFDQDSSTVLYRYGDVGYIFYIICFNLAFQKNR